MTITKNSIINVSRDDGTVILARATKVAPWSKNPNLTVVNWHSFDGKWKGRADARKCTLATAQEVSAATAAIQSAMAPVEGSMKGWTLGDTKRGPMMMEGYYFSAAIFLEGNRVGKIVDSGTGGLVDVEISNAAVNNKFQEDVNKWAMENGADGRYSDAAEHFWSWWDKARPKGIKAADHFKAEKEEMRKYLVAV
jgi:hypothetical protein